MFTGNGLSVDIVRAIYQNHRMFHIGDALIRIRDERKLTQGQLAKMARMRPNTLGDLENKRKKSRIETLEKAAEALGLTVPDVYRKLDELRGVTAIKPAPVVAYSPEHQRLHEELQAVLESDNEYARGAVKFGIEAAYRNLQPSGKGPLPEVEQATGTGEPAARKRKVRGVDKFR